MLQVLIVERDPALAKLYQEELVEAGFRVRVRADLPQAVSDLRSQPVHVLVTDMASAGGGPESWLPHIRQVYQGPVVALGALSPSCGRSPGLSVMPKSSDLNPLICSLRGQALKLMWANAVAGTC